MKYIPEIALRNRSLLYYTANKIEHTNVSLGSSNETKKISFKIRNLYANLFLI